MPCKTPRTNESVDGVPVHRKTEAVFLSDSLGRQMFVVVAAVYL